MKDAILQERIETLQRDITSVIIASRASDCRPPYMAEVERHLMDVMEILNANQ